MIYYRGLFWRHQSCWGELTLVPPSTFYYCVTLWLTKLLFLVKVASLAIWKVEPTSRVRLAILLLCHLNPTRDPFSLTIKQKSWKRVTLWKISSLKPLLDASSMLCLIAEATLWSAKSCATIFIRYVLEGYSTETMSAFYFRESKNYSVVHAQDRKYSRLLQCFPEVFSSESRPLRFTALCSCFTKYTSPTP